MHQAEHVALSRVFLNFCSRGLVLNQSRHDGLDCATLGVGLKTELNSSAKQGEAGRW